MKGSGRRRIYLMRHGHVDYFAPDLTDPRQVPLTEEGREQAQTAGHALQHAHFDMAVYSGLPRTRETAKIVLSSNHSAPDLVAFEGLEEVKSGWIKATSREELAARLAYSFDEADAPGARFLPDGETFSEAQGRITSALEDLVLGHIWRSALVVAHEGVNRIILGWACGGGLATISAFEQDLCCINLLDVDVTPAESGNGLQIERVAIKALNMTAHDYVKKGLDRSSLEHLFDVDFGGLRPKKDWAAE
ncbi:histidine phosphatase family protein [Hyphococcus flavus]|uniref:Histidine phosphatase family protein n=1 Tax=Hyphococcus flavus TaxID=1866326 RepID=A0AAE9ZBK2_9PROT|nr:histidine phosphatase family protein [Hyphococcus flavus]WDI31081.1 histidine phosphatase family protein [Hyphococcus flavus]